MINDFKIKSERQQTTLDYALDKINNSPIYKYINKIYLYGSCARGEEKYTSDVDLFMELNEDILTLPEYSGLLIQLRGAVSPCTSLFSPDTDLRAVIGNKWENSKNTFYENIRKDGIQLWI